MNRSHRIPADPENLYRYLEKTYNGKRVICAYETGGSGYHLHDYLTSRGIRCLMVPPLSIPKGAYRSESLKAIDRIRSVAFLISTS